MNTSYNKIRLNHSSEKCFRWRQQAITWANIDQYLCRHMVPLCHNKLIMYVQILIQFYEQFCRKIHHRRTNVIRILYVKKNTEVLAYANYFCFPWTFPGQLFHE